MYEKMTTDGCKSYLAYLNKLVDEYDTTYHHSIRKKYFDADYSPLIEEIESTHKTPKFNPKNCIFLKIVSFKQRVKLWFFVTSKIIIRYIFPEKLPLKSPALLGLKLVLTARITTDDITFKNVVTLFTCIIKHDSKFYQQIFLKETLLLAVSEQFQAYYSLDFCV